MADIGCKPAEAYPMTVMQHIIVAWEDNLLEVRLSMKKGTT